MTEILYETDEQRKHIHTSWQKVEAIDETYWRCTGCRVTADKPIPPEDDPEKAKERINHECISNLARNK